MLEKDIENLLARYPDEFFPNSGFRLKGQQVNFGKCYADIVFTDKYNRTVLIEVKRGILTREASGQIIEYYGLLKARDQNQIVELILCANVIPHERKVFLENAGIECKELGIALISNIAKKYNYNFLDEIKKEQNPIVSSIPSLQTYTSMNRSISTWIFQANPTRYDILNALSDPNLEMQRWFVNQHRNEIKNGDIALIWISGKESGIYATATIVSDPVFLFDFPAEEKYWTSEVDRSKKSLKVTIKIADKLINSPILRNELQSIAELKNLSILRFAQGTNFPVTSKEWELISKMIEKKR